MASDALGRQELPPDAPRSEMAVRIRRLPDALALIRIDLKPLCGEDRTDIPIQERELVNDACARLHGAIADLTEIVKYVDALEAFVDARRAADRASIGQRGAKA